jgi:RNA polymerase sigma factor (sigma-70 family)
MSIPEQTNAKQLALATKLVAATARFMQKRYDLSDADREDLEQEGTIAALGAIPHYQPDRGAFVTWIGAKTRGRMIDALRKLKSGGVTGGLVVEMVDPEQLKDYSDSEDMEDPDVGLSQDETLAGDSDTEQSVIISQIMDKVSELPFSERELLRLRYGIDRPPHTIGRLATIYGVSGPAILKRLNVITKKLKQSLENDGL